MQALMELWGGLQDLSKFNGLLSDDVYMALQNNRIWTTEVHVNVLVWLIRHAPYLTRTRR